jgi:hypothetical protein
MFPLRQYRRTKGFPVFLLVVAWFCANGPQSLTVDLMEWASGARHFSHQQMLRTQVKDRLT